MLYRITIKRDGATITTLTLQTNDPEQAIKRMARLDFDLQRRQRNATAVVLTDQDGRIVYSYPQSEPA